jgi:AcrR family transcriptional regulator
MAKSTKRFTAEDRRNQILEVARPLFARKGYNGTTTREIASGAGVNEALIFRHFPSKHELYWAVLDGSSRGAQGVSDMENQLNASDDLLEVFAEIATGILDRREKDPTLIRLLLYSALEAHELSQRFFMKLGDQYFRLLGRFVAIHIEQGRFRKVNPVQAARGFLGMVFYYSMVETLFTRKTVEHKSNREAGETIATIWLSGMLEDKAVERTRAPRTSPTRSTAKSGDKAATRSKRPRLTKQP